MLPSTIAAISGLVDEAGSSAEAALVVNAGAAGCDDGPLSTVVFLLLHRSVRHVLENLQVGILAEATVDHDRRSAGDGDRAAAALDRCRGTRSREWAMQEPVGPRSVRDEAIHQGNSPVALRRWIVGGTRWWLRSRRRLPLKRPWKAAAYAAALEAAERLRPTPGPDSGPDCRAGISARGDPGCQCCCRLF